MKTIGLIGGTTWFSTVDYYRIINEQVNNRHGGDEAARLILYSVNYGEIKTLTQQDKWDGILKIIGGAAKTVEAAGADCVLLCANTMHHIASEVQAQLRIPLLHIADATAKAVQQNGLNTVALLGTKYTMQLPFFRERLQQFGIDTILPDAAGIETVNNAIYKELGKGIFTTATKQVFQNLIAGLQARGAQGVILGCTEIPLLIKQEDSPVPVFDTTLLHATAAVDFALAEVETAVVI